MAMEGIHGMGQMEDSHTSTIMGAWTMSHRRLASKRTGKFERQSLCSASVSFVFFLDFEPPALRYASPFLWRSSSQNPPRTHGEPQYEWIASVKM